jgi:hypothetical protein
LEPEKKTTYTLSNTSNEAIFVDFSTLLSIRDARLLQINCDCYVEIELIELINANKRLFGCFSNPTYNKRFVPSALDHKSQFYDRRSYTAQITTTK